MTWFASRQMLSLLMPSMSSVEVLYRRYVYYFGDSRNHIELPEFELNRKI